MGTVTVGILVFGAAALVVKSMIKERKSGKSARCGGDCGHCGGHCH